MMSKSNKKELPPFDKYYYYRKSVQGPEDDVIFLRDTYREITGRPPVTMCEDFCGTFSISCEWLKLDPSFKAIGVDVDPEPINYGRQHYLSQLTKDQQDRIQIIEKSVLDEDLPQVDMISAMNFSYFLFKKRQRLKAYFTSVYNRLNTGGVFLVDCFGGTECQQSTEEETEHQDEGFTYFWDQDNFDPLTNQARFYIHFKRKGEKKREQVFIYDWRVWSIVEIREVMAEVGFSKTHIYWEGTDEDGEGDGNFTRVKDGEHGEECEAWIAYIVAEKN